MTPFETARRRSQEAGVVHPLVRALCAEDVHVAVRDGDQVASSERGGETFVHAHTTAAAAARDGGEVRALRLPQWLLTLPPGTGVRLDPDTTDEVVLAGPLLQLLVATGSGVPTPSALTPVGDERLVPTEGEGLEELDTAVREAVAGRVRRCVVTLDGVGGREWAVYAVDGDGRSPADVVAAVHAVATRPVVVLVDAQPAWVAELLGPALAAAVALPPRD